MSAVEVESRLKWRSEDRRANRDCCRLEAELPQGCGGSVLTPVTSSAFSRHEAHWAVSIAQCAHVSVHYLFMKASVLLISGELLQFFLPTQAWEKKKTCLHFQLVWNEHELKQTTGNPSYDTWHYTNTVNAVCWFLENTTALRPQDEM